MCCTGPCGVENINTEPDKLTTNAEGSLLPNKIYTAVVLTGGIYYTGERYANAANTDKIPSYTLYDIGARYTTRVLNKALTVRLNVINLTGKNYWQNATYLGVPRTVAFSVSTMF